MVILDTSTLILLAKTDLLPLFVKETGARISKEVQKEALANPNVYDSKLINEMIKSKKIHILKSPMAFQRRQIQKSFGIEPGEASALLLARKRGVPLGTDDGKTIKGAKILGVPFFTAIHVLMNLYENNRIDRQIASVKLEKLQEWGRYHTRILENAYSRIEKRR